MKSRAEKLARVNWNRRDLIENDRPLPLHTVSANLVERSGDGNERRNEAPSLPFIYARMCSVVSPKYLYIRCAQIGLGRGAREGVYPQRYSTDGATKPQANFSAARRAACLLGGGVVARSLQIHCGICSSLAPSLRPKSIAANV